MTQDWLSELRKMMMPRDASKKEKLSYVIEIFKIRREASLRASLDPYMNVERRMQMESAAQMYDFTIGVLEEVMETEALDG